MSWFKEWFDTPLYEQLYAHRDNSEAELLAELIQKNYPPETCPEVLDLACGRGRHSINLAKRGYSVLGVDLSGSAIEKANGLITSELENRLEFRVLDMRQPLNQKFDMVVNLFTSFGYFLDDKENESVVAGVSDMLSENGVFILDFLNSERVRQTLVEKEEQAAGDFKVQIRRYIEHNMVNKEMTFTKPGETDSQVFHERVKLYPVGWFEEVFGRHRLSIEQIWGEYDGSAYDPLSSSRLILAARKTN